MEPVIAVLVGVLMAATVYLMLSRSFVRFIFGLALLSHAANLVIFASGGMTRARPPLVAAGESLPPPDIANAVPQALMLTAIVISFSLLTFALVARLPDLPGTGKPWTPTACGPRNPRRRMKRQVRSGGRGIELAAGRSDRDSPGRGRHRLCGSRQRYGRNAPSAW